MAVAALSTERGRVSRFIPAFTARQIDQDTELLKLPFVRDATRAERREGKPGRLFWNVCPTGDQIADEKIGAYYAHRALDFMAATNTSYLIPWAVRDMTRLGREFSGIEIGFLSVITRNAKTAHNVTLWSRQRRVVS